jgi:anti-sigma B factor antagonist
MSETLVTTGLRRPSDAVAVIDIKGDVTAAAEDALTRAYDEANATGPRVVALNFSGLDYMNSGGIGLLVTLLVRANRHRQRLTAFGLTEHYRQIMSLTRLDEAITLYEDEAAALAAAGGAR